MAKRYNILTRFLAATALVFVYLVSVVGTSGLFLAASTSSAQAYRGRGGGYYRGGRGYGGRGYYRGRGYGRVWLWRPLPRRSCAAAAIEPSLGRTICPY